MQASSMPATVSNSVSCTHSLSQITPPHGQCPREANAAAELKEKLNIVFVTEQIRSSAREISARRTQYSAEIVR